MTGSRPLRLGLLVDALQVPAWLATALTAVREQGIGNVTLVIRRTPGEGPVPPGRLRAWWQRRQHLAFALLSRLDERRPGLTPWPAEISLGEVCPAATVIDVRPHTTRFTDAVPTEALESIRSADLDVIIRAGFRILTGGILGAARHGILSFHHGDNRVNRGGPAGVWEVLDQEPTTGLVLQQLSEELDGGRVLARSVGVTKPFSFHRNRQHLYARSGTVLQRTLAQLHKDGTTGRVGSTDEPEWDAFDRRLLRMPTNAEVIRRLPRLLATYAARRHESRLRQNQWQLAWAWDRDRPDHEPAGVLRRYTPVVPPPDRFWADPFVARHGDTYWVFFEELRYATGRGVIAAVRWTREGMAGSPTVVLEEPWHLSFPFIFRHEGRWYLLPDASDSGRVQLYSTATLPGPWHPDRVLLEDCPAVDACLHYQDETWYLFCTPLVPGIAPDEELHLYWSDSLGGPFQPHPMNPLVTDVRRARMAGRLFSAGGSLYRPAQNGTPDYGSGLTIHRVTHLSRAAYREEVVHELRPRWLPDTTGMHTINATGELSFIDLRRLVPR